jgi:aspartyl-tRNA synthetase
MVKYIFKEVKGIDYKEKVERMSWEDAMWNYGIDKPDTRFGFKIQNLKVKNQNFLDVLANTDFGVFKNSESILAICIPDAAEYSRKQTDELTEWVKRPQIGMGGLAFVKFNKDGTLKSSFDKFFDESKLKSLAEKCNAQKGDLVLILAGNEDRTRKAIGELRLEMAERLRLRKPGEFKLLWVLDFPLFEYSEEDKRYTARHHPFTSPKPDQVHLLDDPSSYGNIKANAYDMVLNGNEIGGGSIRIYQRDLQEKMFASLGMSKDEAQHKFGFLLGAFEYGAPPHGGIAFGFDRLCAIIGGTESIRDFIAFPKNNAGRDVMLDAPSEIDKQQLDELGIKINPKKD